jgi:hypothetical protein
MKRRALRNPKRARGGGSNWFNLTVSIIVVVGVALVLISRQPGGSAGSVGPKLNSKGGQPDHWHAAIGVNICGEWQQGPLWPNAQLQRVGTATYAGMHTHTLSDGSPDGIIHMEPQATADAGRNATVGQFMKSGGWKLSASSMQLWPNKAGAVIEHKNGQQCTGKFAGKKAEVRWALGSYTSGKKTQLTERNGNPSSLKLYNDNVVAIYFVPADTKLDSLGAVPSEKNLVGATNREGMPGSGTSTTVAGGTSTTTATATTVAGGSSTTGAAPTTTPTAPSTTTK